MVECEAVVVIELPVELIVAVVGDADVVPVVGGGTTVAVTVNFEPMGTCLLLTVNSLVADAIYVITSCPLTPAGVG